MKIRSYTELSKLGTFEERFRYLRLNGQVGIDTFGFDRIFNQMFYRSPEWRAIRNLVIVRDNGCDLGIPGYEISGEQIVIHHMNPISIDDIKNSTDILLNPEYLITTIHSTHNAIHYRSESTAPRTFVNRTKYDTCPWRL